MQCALCNNCLIVSLIFLLTKCLFIIVIALLLNNLARYSASLWGTTLDQLVVAVGTVFNEVLVWNPFQSLNSRDMLNSTNLINSKEGVSKRLKGHEVTS